MFPAFTASLPLPPSRRPHSSQTPRRRPVRTHPTTLPHRAPYMTSNPTTPSSDPATVSTDTFTLPINAVATAHAAADAAAQILRRHFRQPIPVDFKADHSPVTVADRLAEDAIRSVILSKFPRHVVIGEEAAAAAADDDSTANADVGETGFAWVVDPIDGTRAFVCGRPTFTILIALLHNGIPVLGLVDQPIVRERWLGQQGHPTLLNGQPVTVRPRAPLSACVLQATTPNMFVGVDAVKFGKLERVARNVVYGGDAYAYALLASGCGDVVVEADLKPWDILALVPVVEGAGGVMSDWGGAPLGLRNDGRAVAAASRDVFDEVVGILGIARDAGLYPGGMQVSDDLAVADGGLPDDPGEGHVESMTGFGRAEVQRNGYAVAVEVRSVNSRFCEVQMRGAAVLAAHEGMLVNVVKKAARRGKIVVSVNVQCAGEEGVAQKKVGVKVDKEAVREVSRLLQEVATTGGTAPASVGDLLKFSEVLVREDSAVAVDELMPVAKEAVAKAVEKMRAARRREGALLEEDLMKRTRKICEVVQDIEMRADDRVDAERRRLAKALRVLDSAVAASVDAARLETELAVWADKVDFTEEAVRLRSHVTLFELTFLGAHEPIGQRLGFLLQEMHREANTLASKASNSAVSHLTVLVKEEIEKIREQVVNLR